MSHGRKSLETGERELGEGEIIERKSMKFSSPVKRTKYFTLGKDREIMDKIHGFSLQLFSLLLFSTFINSFLD